jgi:hypothetical protein
MIELQFAYCIIKIVRNKEFFSQVRYILNSIIRLRLTQIVSEKFSFKTPPDYFLPVNAFKATGLIFTCKRI